MMNIDNESTCSSQETPDLVPSTVMVRTTSGKTATEVSPQETTQIVPRELTGYDILCGRNKLAFNHVGNRRFRVTISLFLNQYFQKPGRTDRSILILHILETIHKAGGRFLKEETNSHGNDDDSMSTSSSTSTSNSSYWVELSEKEQRNKIGHALRDAAAAHHLAQEKKKKKQMVAAKRQQRLAAAAASSQAIPTVIHSSSLVQAHHSQSNVNVAVQQQQQEQYQRQPQEEAPRRRSSSLRSSFKMLSSLFQSSNVNGSTFDLITSPLSMSDASGCVSMEQQEGGQGQRRRRRISNTGRVSSSEYSSQCSKIQPPRRRSSIFDRISLFG